MACPNYDIFLSLRIIFTLTNSVNPDEMPHDVAFHQGFHCLSSTCLAVPVYKGRPKLTWKKLMEKDCSEWKFTTVNPQERSTWRSGVRSAMGAASQLPGRGNTVTLMWMMPLHLHVNQKSDYDDHDADNLIVDYIFRFTVIPAQKM